MATLKLSSPWAIYAREVSELFKYDDQVHVVFDDENYKLKIYVDNGRKAAALEKILPQEKSFGNVTISITVVPANDNYNTVFTTNKDIYCAAFTGNRAFSFITETQGVFTNNLTYVVFNKTVVQYFNDDLSDVYGQCSTLYQDLAKHVFVEQEGVFFCTDNVDPVFSIGVDNISWP